MSLKPDAPQRWMKDEAEIQNEKITDEEPTPDYPLPQEDSQKVTCHGDTVTHGNQILSQQHHEKKKIESYETDYDRIKQTLNCIKLLYHGSGNNNVNKMLKKTTSTKSRRSSNRNKASCHPSEEKKHNTSASEALIAQESDACEEGYKNHETDCKHPPIALSKTTEIAIESKMFNHAECNTEALLEISRIQKLNDKEHPHYAPQINSAKGTMSDAMNNVLIETQKSDPAVENNVVITKSEVVSKDAPDTWKEERHTHKIKNNKLSTAFIVTTENGYEPVRDLTKTLNSAQTPAVVTEASSDRLEFHETKTNKYAYNLSQLYAEKIIKSDTINNLLADVHDNVNGDSKLNIPIEEAHRKSRSRKSKDRHQMRYENVERYMASMQSEENAPERETDDILVNRQNSPEHIEVYERAKEEGNNCFVNYVYDNNDFVYNTDYPRNAEEQYLNRKSGKQKLTKAHKAHSVSSADTLQTAMVKKKTKNKKNEKKTSNAGHCTLPMKQKCKRIEEVLSVTTKSKKKKVSKLKIIDSRNTIGHKPECGVERDKFSPTESYSTTQVPYQLWPTDNVVELYHNAATKSEATKSDRSVNLKPERDIKMTLPQKSTKMTNRKLPNHTQKMNMLSEDVINEDKMHEQMENVEQLFTNRSERNHTNNITDQNQPKELTGHKHSLHDFSESPTEMMTVEVIKQKVPVSKPFKKILKSSKNCGIQRKPTRASLNVPCQDANVLRSNGLSIITDKKRNFELPTLSSQSKHVCSSSLQKFDFHTIPFVVGTSTTPSHNLGLNIQQTLSIMKLHRSTSGQSPMELANVFLREKQHTLAGEHLQPVSSLQSRLNGYTEWQSCCPALIRTTDTPDILKKEETQVDSKDSVPPNEKCLETEIQSENRWSLDDKPDNFHAHCTCYPSPPCTDFQSLLSAYLEGGSKCSIPAKPKIPYSGLKPQNFRFRNQQNFARASRVNGVSNNIGKLLNGREDVDSIPTKENCLASATTILENNKQERKDRAYLKQLTDQNKGLKDILINLHSDFVRLNNKYEELKITSKNDQGKNNEVLKELQVVEAELEAKEDEITVLMNLYEEVMTLKQQTKALMQRVSNPCLSTAEKDGQRIAPRETSVAFLLTRLLRSIQHIQEKLRQD